MPGKSVSFTEVKSCDRRVGRGGLGLEHTDLREGQGAEAETSLMASRVILGGVSCESAQHCNL